MTRWYCVKVKVSSHLTISGSISISNILLMIYIISSMKQALGGLGQGQSRSLCLARARRTVKVPTSRTWWPGCVLASLELTLRGTALSSDHLRIEVGLQGCGAVTFGVGFRAGASGVGQGA